jgi:hypothetical protein
MEFDEIIAGIERWNDLIDRIEAAGGISYESVLDNVATVPVGYVQDQWTGYYLPPGFDPHKARVVN